MGILDDEVKALAFRLAKLNAQRIRGEETVPMKFNGVTLPIMIEDEIDEVRRLLDSAIFQRDYCPWKDKR